MKTIWKYPLKTNIPLDITIVKGYNDSNVYGSFKIEVPKNAKILSVKTQRNTICLWFIVESEQKEKEIRIFHKIGTGRAYNIKDNFQFIDTIFMDDGMYVYHIFEEVFIK